MYISNNLYNESASQNLKGIIESKLSNISIFPTIGTSVTDIASDISIEFKSFRKSLAKNYILLYVYKQTLNTAFVTHIFHQTQDYGKLFQN